MSQTLPLYHWQHLLGLVPLLTPIVSSLALYKTMAEYVIILCLFANENSVVAVILLFLEGI